MNNQSIDPLVLGERLRAARSGVDLTQEGAANALGLSRTTLVAIENGQRRAKADELVRMAELYKTTTGHLVALDSVHVDLAAKFRRIENRPRKPSANDAIRLLNALVSGAIELERTLGIDVRYDYPPAIQINSNSFLRQAEDAAVYLRNRLGLGLGRIDDLATVLELDLGVRIFYRPLPDPDISGLFAFDDAVGGCILINSNHHWHRRIQSLSHELGHLMADRSVADVVDNLDFGLSWSERFARRFGGAFLMPAPHLRTRFDLMLQERGSVDVQWMILLAHQYGVATEAMCRRLEELELLADGTWQSIRDRGYNSNLERQVLGDPIQLPPPPLLSPRLASLAATAIDRGLLSEGQVCELLVLDRVQLRRALRPFQAAAVV